MVVFDRVRENLRKYKKTPLMEVLNLSINETLSRTVMTSVTTLLALISLYVLGGDVIRGFVFAMIWGVVVGTYSSVFVASAILLFFGVKRDWSKPDANAGHSIWECRRLGHQLSGAISPRPRKINSDPGLQKILGRKGRLAARDRPARTEFNHPMAHRPDMGGEHRGGWALLDRDVFTQRGGGGFQHASRAAGCGGQFRGSVHGHAAFEHCHVMSGVFPSEGKISTACGLETPPWPMGCRHRKAYSIRSAKTS